MDYLGGSIVLPKETTLDQHSSHEQLLCPSARCGEGALLVGIIGPDGKIGYVNPALPIDKKFVERSRGGRGPEQRFRFAAPCQKSGCVHWSGTRCGVIDQARAASEATQTGNDSLDLLPRCGIRRQCRWFAQSGLDACSVCPFVFNYVWPENKSH
jgi:hypothetical protein